MTAAPNPFDRTTNSAPGLSFSERDQYGQLQSKPVGTRLGGRVTKSPEIVQTRGYEGPFKSRPLYWDNDGQGKKTDQASTADGRPNSPVEDVVVTLVPPGETEPMSLWVPYYPKDMIEAIQTALEQPGKTELQVIEAGDDLFITLTGKRPVTGKNPAHTYSAEFVKGAGTFARPPAASNGHAPALAPPAPPPPAPAPAVTPEGYTLAGLLGAGWTAEQAVATYPVLGAAPVPVAAVVPAPPAPPVALTAEQVQAKRDALSPQDKALLGL